MRVCKVCEKEFYWKRKGLRTYCSPECKLAARRKQNDINLRVFRRKKKMIEDAPYSQYLSILINNAQRDPMGAKRLRRYILSLTERDDYENYEVY